MALWPVNTACPVFNLPQPQCFTVTKPAPHKFSLILKSNQTVTKQQMNCALTYSIVPFGQLVPQLDTPLAQAQVNLVERLLDRFGSLPTPEQLRAVRGEPGLLLPTSQMRTVNEHCTLWPGPTRSRSPSCSSKAALRSMRAIAGITPRH